MNQEVLAVVAGEEITQAEFDAFLQNLPSQQQAYISNPQFRQQCLEQLIALYSFAKMAEDEKLDQTEEFETVLKRAKRDILAQLAMRETLKGITVSEEESKAYYDANMEQFKKGETVRAKHILVDSEEQSNSILESITSGEKEFEAAAMEFSTCPSKAQGGDLGEFGKGQMVKEFEDAAFAAEIGHVVGPVKSQFGYHLIKVEDKKEASVAAFDEVKENIRINLIQQKQNTVYNEKVASLKEKYVQK